MTTTYEAMNNQLQASLVGSQLPTYEWQKDEDKILNYLETRGLPSIPGKRWETTADNIDNTQFHAKFECAELVVAQSSAYAFTISREF